MNQLRTPFAQADIRLWQLLVMAALLTLGVFWRDFSLQAGQIALTFAFGLLTQGWFLRRAGLWQRGFLSAAITCFGLCLLLRSSNYWAHPLAASVAMASKYWLRADGAHLFNPANFGVVLALALLPNTWVTSGQWGADLSSTGWLLAAGWFVADNARRLDISGYFLASYATLLLAVRVLWYGYPWAVFLHQFQNGALLLFAFFMVTDPMTIPRARLARFFHAALVALLAYLWQYGLYQNQGILWGLFFASPLVPLWNRLFPAPAYQWQPMRH